MKPPPPTTDLTLSRSIPASPADIYDVWLDPQSPGGPWFGAERVILNPAVDGLFYHSIAHAGRTWAHYGRFVELARPSKLVYTWLSAATQGLETIVTVTLEAQGAQTLVTLTHTGVPDDEMGRQHKDGWSWTLEMLAKRFSKRA